MNIDGTKCDHIEVFDEKTNYSVKICGSNKMFEGKEKL